jgi:iron complex transport system permease protein
MSLRRGLPIRPFLAAFLLLALLLLALAHLLLAAKSLSPLALWRVMSDYDPHDFDQRIILALRLPRFLAVVLAGAALGAAGFVMQAALRNRLAEPHVLGLNAGASLAIVACTVFPLLTPEGFARPLIASLGAAMLFTLVLAIAHAGRGDPGPAKLLFCGIAFAALANALSSALLLLDEQSLDALRFWLIGDAAGVRLAAVVAAAPFVALGLILAALVMPQLGVLALGDEMARGLGTKARQLRILALIAAALLAGASVSLLGPVSFVGLVAPALWSSLHSRPSVGALAVMAATGAAILLAADIAATNLLRPTALPTELPTGALTGLVGAPVFLWVFARRSR